MNLTTEGEKGWNLEVVRGREVGRIFALGPGASVLGNALNGEPGIDLGAQEGTSPRRMAARQARVDRSAQGLSLRDLDSPGGTFVNRQRVLPGQAIALAAGDVIQLCAVQLKVVVDSAKAMPTVTASAPASSAPARPGSLVSPFVLATGVTCRTWDDFLTASARSWPALRDELTSGRLGTFLHAAGRDDLAPAARSAKTADERLDEWLDRLPASRSAQPELDVHPSVVRIRAHAGGGVTRTKVQITNTGYRLLRSTVRIEPEPSAWVRLPPGLVNVPFATAETSEIALDVEVPETLGAPLSAFLVIESNGGSRRVEIRVEPPSKPQVLPDEGADLRDLTGTTLRDALARRSPGARLIGGALGALCLRATLVLGDLMTGAARMDDGSKPSLAGAGVVLAFLGAIVAGWLAARSGERRDVPPGVFAGAFGGLLAATLAVGVCRSIETGLIQSPLSACALWTILGFLGGLGSLGLVPHRLPEGEP